MPRDSNPQADLDSSDSFATSSALLKLPVPDLNLRSPTSLPEMWPIESVLCRTVSTSQSHCRAAR